MKAMKKVLLAGGISASVVGILYCLIFALYGPLGDSKGFLLEDYVVVGNISRYWDPVIIGITIILTFFCLKYAPPSLTTQIMRKIRLDPKSYLDIAAIGFFFYFMIFLTFMFLGIIKEDDLRLDGDYRFNPAFILLTVLVPFGMRGALMPLVALFIIFWIRNGAIVGLFVVLGTWLGKWILWWFLFILSLWWFLLILSLGTILDLRNDESSYKEDKKSIK